MTDISSLQTVAVLTENGLIVTLRNPDELELAYRWALNGKAISFQIRTEATTQIEDEVAK